ncbi:hypothetical protein FB565_005259 [Actinoplanes lutulentus]|uniref:SurA-like protein n=1 Tax=Actinoplanes lutulentus TaxID=1287878 RepID=A0A327ZGR1_9ACTN|nr:hypothetical protein [Actinoplanes lutulentus]MBB2945526.1 hypothetical protein [Actinoplanes lutulentus]RAK40342.1 hypothetical protein B0I29_103375 [Actinoplanes lutulentus]
MTMMRARSLVSVVVAASLAVGGLSGCRSQPAVAVYIGQSGHITEHHVQQIWDETSELVTSAAAGQAARMPIARVDIVGLLLTNELYDRVAKQQKVTLPATMPYAEVAEQIGLPDSAELTRIYTQNLVLRQNLLQSVSAAAAEPSDEDLRGVYQQFADNQAINLDFAGFKKSLQAADKKELQGAFTLRDEVESLVGELDVEISPRYEDVVLGIYSYTDQASGRSFPIVSVPFGDPDAKPLVVDVA